MANDGIKTPLEVKQGGWTFSDVNQHRGGPLWWSHKWPAEEVEPQGRMVTKTGPLWWLGGMVEGGGLDKDWWQVRSRAPVAMKMNRASAATDGPEKAKEVLLSTALLLWRTGGSELCSRSASSWLQAQPAHTGHRWRRDLRTWHPGGTASPRTTLSSRVLMTGQVLMESGSYSGVSHGLSLAVLFKKETTNWHHLKFSLSAWIIAVASSCSKMCGSGEPQISETNSRAKDRRLLKLIKSKTSIIKTGKTNSEIQSKLLTLEFPEISQGQHAENIRYTREVWCTRGHKETEATRGNKISGNWRVLRYSWI